MIDRLPPWDSQRGIVRRHRHSDKAEITSTVRWTAIATAFLFLALTISFVLSRRFPQVVVSGVSLVPIMVSILLLRRDSASLPSAILAISLIFAITGFSTLGQGLYDIAVLGYPVVLIIAGLILEGQIIWQLTILILLCMAWLVFGNLHGYYQPAGASQTSLEDFFIGSFIILVGGNAVYRLARNVYENLARSKDEVLRRREAESRLESANHQLNLKNQELDRFAIRVSHDLKTPLITLAGYLGYLEKDIEEGNYDRAARGFSQINDAAKTMGRFVDELLDLSRIGRVINPPADVPFGEIVQDALRATEGLLEANQVQVETDANFPVVHADRVRIVQVMQNLITNAVKFRGDQAQPKIKIGFRNIDGEPVFFVSDNGIGIEAEFHDGIFELFGKIDQATEGTGIGLGIVKRILEVHKGRIWVESEPGKGATFFFTLAEKPARS